MHHLTRDARQAFPDFNQDPGFPAVGIFWQDAIANSAMFYFLNQGIMMRFMAAELEQQGVNPERIHVSMERNMQCAIATCGHCQLGSELLCRDGAVYPWPRMAPLMTVREL